MSAYILVALPPIVPRDVRTYRTLISTLVLADLQQSSLNPTISGDVEHNILPLYVKDN